MIFGIQTATDIDSATRRIVLALYPQNRFLREKPPLDRRGLRNELLAAIKAAMLEIRLAEPNDDSTQVYITSTERSVTVLALCLYQLLHRERTPHLVDKALSGGYPKKQGYLFETAGTITEEAMNTDNHYRLKPYDHAQRNEQLRPFKDHLIAKFPVLYAILMSYGYQAALQALDLSRPRKWSSERWQNSVLPTWQAYFRELGKEAVPDQLQLILKGIADKLGFIYGRAPVNTPAPITIPTLAGPPTEGTPLMTQARRSTDYSNAPAQPRPAAAYNRLERTWDEDDSSNDDGEDDSLLPMELHNPMYDAVPGAREEYSDVRATSATSMQAAASGYDELATVVTVDIQGQRPEVTAMDVRGGKTEKLRASIREADIGEHGSEVFRFGTASSSHAVTVNVLRQRHPTASMDTQAEDERHQLAAAPTQKPPRPAVAPRPQKRAEPVAPEPAPTSAPRRRVREQPTIMQQRSIALKIEEFFSHKNVCNYYILAAAIDSSDPVIDSLRETDKVFPEAQQAFATDDLDRLHRILRRHMCKDLDTADQRSTEATLERDSVILGMRFWKFCDTNKATLDLNAASAAIQQCIAFLGSNQPVQATTQLLEHKLAIYCILLDGRLPDGQDRTHAITALTRLINREWLARNQSQSFYRSEPPAARDGVAAAHTGTPSL